MSIPLAIVFGSQLDDEVAFGEMFFLFNISRLLAENCLTIHQSHSLWRRSVYEDGCPFSLPLQSLLCPPFLSPSSLSFRELDPYYPAVRSGEHCKLPQWVAKRFTLHFSWIPCLWWHKINSQPLIYVTTGILNSHCTQLSNDSIRIADNLVKSGVSYHYGTPSWSNLYYRDTMTPQWLPLMHIQIIIIIIIIIIIQFIRRRNMSELLQGRLTT